MSKILEVKTVEPAALSPKGTAVYLSLSKRTISGERQKSVSAVYQNVIAAPFMALVNLAG